MAEKSPFIVVILGPTAAGKSALAARLAGKLAGEVVGVDSVQVYRGLNAASGKPPASLRAAVPHHLIDIADPKVDFSAGDFSRLARKAIEEIAGRGRVPVLAGGTGLYLRALLRGIAEMPARHPPVREALAAWAGRRGEGALHRMLRELDPEWAAGLPPRDTQRIVRAIEVALVSGRPLSRWVASQPFRDDAFPSIKIGLRLSPPILEARIGAKVDEFFQNGLVQEVHDLLAAGVPKTANCFKALGYREVLRHVEGEADLAETRRLVKANTRRYAKRQMTWFRREPGVSWFELEEDPEAQFTSIDALVTRAIRSWES